MNSKGAATGGAAIGGGAAITGGAAIAGRAASAGGTAISGEAAIGGGAALAGGAALGGGAALAGGAAITGDAVGVGGCTDGGRDRKTLLWCRTSTNSLVTWLVTAMVVFRPDRLAPHTPNRFEFWSRAMVCPSLMAVTNSFK